MDGQREWAGDAVLARAVGVVRNATCGEEYEAVWDLLSRVAEDPVAALRYGMAMLASGDPAVRGTGCDLLGVTADEHRETREPAATALVMLGEDETDGEVLWSLARALGSTADVRTVRVLAGLAGHDDADVRFQVACALPPVWTEDPQAAEVQTLISLTTDRDPEVRNWATFGLGTLLAAADTPGIRAALRDRLSDSDAETREEAVCGLARRRDRTVTGLLGGLLAADEGAHVLVFEAAAILGAPELLPALGIYEPSDPGVAEAIAECDPAARTARDEFGWTLLHELCQQQPDIDAALSCRRHEAGITLEVTASGQMLAWSVGALMAKAGADPQHGASMVLADLRSSNLR
jgi:hypothetical protein